MISKGLQSPLQFSLCFHNNFPLEQAEAGIAVNVTDSGADLLDLATVRTDDSSQINTSCECYTCSEKYTVGYLSHLWEVKELNSVILTGMHNLWQYAQMVKRLN